MPAEADTEQQEDLPAPPAEPVRPHQRDRRWYGTVVAILIGYVACVAGYFWLDSSSQVLAPRNLSSGAETVVLLELTAVRPVDNAVDVNVLVIPEKSLVDGQFGVINTDMAVRLSPSTDSGELNYPRGHTPGREFTSMSVAGDADRWPFDTFSTGTISAEVFVGTGEARRYVPARVEVAGSLNGWDIGSERVGPLARDGHTDDNATITLSRSRGPLLLIAGYCLVLLTLPALAWFVALELLMGRKTFQPAFSTWFAAMLFSVVPIRNVLPGNPPAGSWVDEAITVWVLLALTAAMAIYVVAWARRPD